MQVQTGSPVSHIFHFFRKKRISFSFNSNKVVILASRRLFYS